MTVQLFPTVNLLPGPVSRFSAVDRAFRQEPVSHRSDAFYQDFAQLQYRLKTLTSCHSVHLMSGSGTLANEAVAAQLSLLEGSGIILSFGEFGERLVQQAKRWGLRFEVISVPWEEAFSLSTLASRLSEREETAWIWTVHCETSTGQLLNIAELVQMGKRHQAKICLDTVSSLGNTNVDLSGIHLASGTSGKGWGAYPGIAMLFQGQALPSRPDRLPGYLDIGLFAEKRGIPFTLNSNLFYALKAGVEHTGNARHWNHLRQLSNHLQEQLNALELPVMMANADRMPNVLTIALPHTQRAYELGDFLKRKGVLVSYQSSYLQERNWIQFCLMGDQSIGHLERLVALLQRHYRKAWFQVA